MLPWLTFLASAYGCGLLAGVDNDANRRRRRRSRAGRRRRRCADDDGCGTALDCGSCAAPDTCGGGGNEGVCGCTPASCESLGVECGSASDGCGGTLRCRVCDRPRRCTQGRMPLTGRSP